MTATIMPLHTPTTVLAAAPIIKNLSTRIGHSDARKGRSTPGCADLFAQNVPRSVVYKRSESFQPELSSILTSHPNPTIAIRNPEAHFPDEIEHGSWIKHVHDSGPFDESDLGDMIPIDHNNEDAKEYHEAAAAAGNPSYYTSFHPTSRQTVPIASSFVSTTGRANVLPNSRQQTAHIHTRIRTADPRCPYPYPHIYCGEPTTTLITISKTEITSPPEAYASEANEKKSKHTNKNPHDDSGNEDPGDGSCGGCLTCACNRNSNHCGLCLLTLQP